MIIYDLNFNPYKCRFYHSRTNTYLGFHIFQLVLRRTVKTIVSDSLSRKPILAWVSPGSMIMKKSVLRARKLKMVSMNTGSFTQSWRMPIRAASYFPPPTLPSGRLVAILSEFLESESFKQRGQNTVNNFLLTWQYFCHAWPLTPLSYWPGRAELWPHCSPRAPLTITKTKMASRVLLRVAFSTRPLLTRVRPSTQWRHLSAVPIWWSKTPTSVTSHKWTPSIIGWQQSRGMASEELTVADLEDRAQQVLKLFDKVDPAKVSYN